MKKIFRIALVLAVAITSCNGRGDDKEILLVNKNSDTTIVKLERAPSGPNEVGLYSRFSHYLQLIGGDTSDYSIGVSEYISDSSISLNFFHKDQMMFSSVLKMISDCLPEIAKDYDLTRLKYISFRCPVHYPDLSNALWANYESRFGRKRVGYDKAFKFLLDQPFITQINELIRPFGRKADDCSIEKLELAKKEGFWLDHRNFDFSDYPEYVIHGMGLSVRFTSLNKSLKN